MIVPSIDLMAGRAVQLVGGEKLQIDAGDPRPIADRFALVGEIAVIDLDAAKSEGSNSAVVSDLIARAPCRVGGGIRTRERAVELLDAGASKVIIGTAATPQLLSTLPKERLIAALDEKSGQVVDRGWRNPTGAGVLERIAQLRDHVGGFLVTFVDVEGSMKGLPLSRVAELVHAAGDARVTVAGGLASADEVGHIDRLGADVQVGMALYSGRVTLADALASTLTTDRPDGLWPTIVTDPSGVALGLVYSNRQSLALALDSARGVYWSRSRNQLWEKGLTSGDAQRLLRVTPDCDRDALRFTVEQSGRGFCHQGVRTCFADSPGLPGIAAHIASRAKDAPQGSYTNRLLQDPALLRAKLTEEAAELADARSPDHAAWEAADLFYFALVAMARAGVDLPAVERHLARRALKLSRRPGEAKNTADAKNTAADQEPAQ